MRLSEYESTLYSQGFGLTFLAMIVMTIGYYFLAVKLNQQKFFDLTMWMRKKYGVNVADGSHVEGDEKPFQVVDATGAIRTVHITRAKDENGRTAKGEAGLVLKESKDLTSV